MDKCHGRTEKDSVNYSGSETRKNAYDMTFDFGLEGRKKNSGKREQHVYGDLRQDNYTG